MIRKNVYGALYANKNLTKEDRGPEWEKLEIALEDPNITNIAILAPYDTGKSSFLLSFFEKWKYSRLENIKRKIKGQKDVYRFISVPNFFEDIKENKKSEIELEKDILDQLLLESKASRLKFPDSYIKRIYSINLFSIVGSYLLILLLFWIISNGKFILNPNQFWNNIGLIILGIFGFAIYYVFIHYLNKLTPQLSTKFKGYFSTINADLIPSSETNKRDKFVEYNDELRYFFDKSGIRFVVFEDLDRYNKPVIFQRLRALNKRLNNLRKKPIVFIYTLRDSTFSQNIKDTNKFNENYAAENRAKFFDYIISIFPLHNLENSRDEFYEQKCQCKHELLIDEKYFYGIGMYIHDRREIITIMSDVDTYAQKLNLAGIRKKADREEAFNKLFGLMVYKNVYSEDFDKLITGESFLSQLIHDKKEIIEVISKEGNTGGEFNLFSWNYIFQILNKDNIEKFPFSKEIRADLKRLFDHPIFMYLIVNNLLCEDYHNYLSPTFFSLTSPGDRIFINRVLSYQKIRISEKLDNPLKVLTYLNQVNADYTYAYSVDLLIELFNQTDLWNQMQNIKTILSVVRERRDYKFILNFFYQNSNLSKTEKIRYVNNSWDTFFEDVLNASLRIKERIIDYILEGMVEKEDQVGVLMKYLTKNNFLNIKDVQKVLIHKLNISKSYVQKFSILVMHSKQKCKFKNLNDFNFNNKILKLLIRKEWYERNNKNFTLILKLSINNEKNL